MFCLKLCYIFLVIESTLKGTLRLVQASRLHIWVMTWVILPSDEKPPEHTDKEMSSTHILQQFALADVQVENCCTQTPKCYYSYQLICVNTRSVWPKIWSDREAAVTAEKDKHSSVDDMKFSFVWDSDSVVDHLDSVHLFCMCIYFQKSHTMPVLFGFHWWQIINLFEVQCRSNCKIPHWQVC